MTAAPAAIPVNLVTGFLGVGKTSAIRHLLTGRRDGEKWAVLVNEFGEVGVDGGLLGEPGIAVEEVAGGCLCCVAAPAFSVALHRLIRHQRPDRILIEPSGLAQPAQLLATLDGPMYRSLLQVAATVCLLDARHLRSARHREHPVFQEQIRLADVLVANKTDRYSAADVAAFETFAAALEPAKPVYARVAFGRLDRHWLDLGRATGHRASCSQAHALSATRAPATTTGDAAGDWLLVQGRADGYQRAGWLIRQRRPWPAASLAAWLRGLAVERKKGLFLTDQGWLAVNQQTWTKARVPPDGRARLELIDSGTIDSGAIDRLLRRLQRQCAAMAD